LTHGAMDQHAQRARRALESSADLVIAGALNVMAMQDVARLVGHLFHARAKGGETSPLILGGGLALENLGDLFEVIALDGNQPALTGAKAGLDDAPGGGAEPAGRLADFLVGFAVLLHGRERDFLKNLLGSDDVSDERINEARQHAAILEQ